MGQYVQIDAKIEFPVSTDRASQFSSFNIEPTRNKVEAAVFGNKVDTIAKGTYMHSFSANVRPDTDMAFMLYLAQALVAEADIAILYRPKNAAQSTTNPTLTFSVAVTSMPPLGVKRGDLFEGNLDLQIQTAITWTDGTNTVTIG